MTSEKTEQLVEKFRESPDEAVKRVFAELRAVMATVEGDPRMMMMLVSGVENHSERTQGIVDGVWRELRGQLLDQLWEFEDGDGDEG